MELMDALSGRRSIRRYEDRPVPRDAIDSLLEAAEKAPSAGNLRGRRYVVVSNPGIKNALAAAAYGQRQVESAPVLIVVCADVPRSSSRYGDRGSLYAIQDATVAAMCLLLRAHDMGLGACWSGAFDEGLVEEILSLERGVVPVAILSLGWPAEMPGAARGRGLEEMTRWVE